MILTAAEPVEQRVTCLNLGADDFMAKPVDLSAREIGVGTEETLFFRVSAADWG